MIRSGILVLSCPYRRMIFLGILLLMLVLTCLSWLACLDLLVFCNIQLDMQWKLSTYYLERNSNFLLLRNYLSLMYSFDPRPIISPVYSIISWCSICRLLWTSESANFLLEIQASCTSMSITLTFGMCTQNLELRGMEPATKFCNWIRRSSWEHRYSHMSTL